MNAPRTTATITVLVCTLLTESAAGENLASRVDQYLSRFVESGNFHGAILIARAGQVLVSKGYGMANLELDVPNTPRTKFRSGSVTKQFTAMAIMILHEQGKLRVQDPISTHLDDCPNAWKQITIHHLLTHHSGIPGDFMARKAIVEGITAIAFDELYEIPQKKNRKEQRRRKKT